MSLCREQGMFVPFLVALVLLLSDAVKPDNNGGRLLQQNVNYFQVPGGGFVWTDWGWGGVRPSASDEVVTGETRGEAGAERRVRELEENNGTETTPSAGEEEVTTTSDAIEQDLIIDTTTSALATTGQEEVIIKLIEDNENQEKQLADSLEEVINNLSEIVDEESTTIEPSSQDDSSENATVGGGDTTTEEEEIEATTESVNVQNDDLSVANEPGDSTQEPIVQNFITQQALDRLNGANLTDKDMKILTALLELETLKGEQKDTRQEIENKLTELELLLDADNSLSIDDIEQLVVSQTSAAEAENQKPRRGKTAAEFQAAVDVKTQAVNLFENIQKQLFKLLDERHKFLRIVSDKINSELSVIQQTVNFLQQLVNLKLDQGILLLGENNPLLRILRTGSTSVFLTLTKFFQAVESVLGMREQFLRIFSFDSTAIQETRLLERIQELKINKILPTKIRFLVNVHANSDKLGALLEQMFSCIGQIVDAKVDVIESVGKFFENKIKFLSGLNGGGRNPQEIVEAVATGNLFDLVNFGPVHQVGLPVISDQELEAQVEAVLHDTNPQIPVLGPAKPLLVDHRVLGMLSGRSRDRFVNRYLARRLAMFIATSSSVLDIKRGQTVLQSSLQPLSLGSHCTNDIRMGRSHMTAVVTRSSRVSATLGPTIYSHAPASLDLIGNARLLTNVATSGHVNAKFGHEMFGKCFSKFSGSSPYSLAGSAVVDAHVKVVVRHVRIETRVVKSRDLLSPLLGSYTRHHVGSTQPHLVFNFNIKVDGTVVNFDVTKLKLSGCELKLLGFKMFSHCDLLESLIRRQMEKLMRDTFPLHDRELLYKLQKMIKQRLGEEIAIPLILSDLASTGRIERLIKKTGELIDLNIQFFNLLTMFSQDMQKFNTLDEEKNVISTPQNLTLSSRYPRYLK